MRHHGYRVLRFASAAHREVVDSLFAHYESFGSRSARGWAEAVEVLALVFAALLPWISTLSREAIAVAFLCAGAFWMGIQMILDRIPRTPSLGRRRAWLGYWTLVGLVLLASFGVLALANR